MVRHSSLFREIKQITKYTFSEKLKIFVPVNSCFCSETIDTMFSTENAM